jgi:hypothetical protein
MLKEAHPEAEKKLQSLPKRRKLEIFLFAVPS